MSDETKLVVAAAPHITGSRSTRGIMLAVILALLPTLVASTILFGWQVLLLCGVTVAACVAFELAYCVLLKRPVPVGDFSAVVTGLILAFNLPPTFPLWMAIIGAFVAIVVTKQLFGGIGFNFANPALVGRIVLQLSFTGAMIDYSYPQTLGGVDALSSATPLFVEQSSHLPLIDMLLGTHGGTLGETCAITLLLGGLFLIFIRVISPAIPLCYLGGVFVLKLALLFGAGAAENGFSAALGALSGNAYDAVLYLMAGGLLLGAFFMATDYTTSPYTLKGKVVFGVCLAVLTVAIREWSNTSEGVSYALLIMNLLVPYFNILFRQRPTGVAKRRARQAKAQKEVA